MKPITPDSFRRAFRATLIAAAFTSATTPHASAQQTVNPAAAAARQPLPPQSVHAFVDVNVLPMDRDIVLPSQTVVVRAGRIVAIGPSASTPVPDDAERIDGRGKFLAPGLAEMHGHMPTAEGATSHQTLFLYVANGITSVRGMQGGAYHITMRDQIARGELLGPRFHPAGPQLSQNSAPNPQAARAAVLRQKEQGFDLLKIQEGLSRDVYDTIVATAREIGIPFGGHVPDAVGLWHALDSKQGTIDHLDNYMEAIQAAEFPPAVLALVPETPGMTLEQRKIRAVARATRLAGVAVVPTMPLWELLYVPPDSAGLGPRPDLAYMSKLTVSGWYNRLRAGGRVPKEQYAAWVAMRNNILKALSDEGVMILLGTDSPQLFSVPGFSIHFEMRGMATAGMTPYQILRSGTWNVAEHLELLTESGSIAVGKRADLLLLNRNPLERVEHLEDRSGVMVDGRWLPENEIQRRLARIAESHGAAG
jgi:hypothetical protein